jgi:hypothetical protein
MTFGIEDWHENENGWVHNIRTTYGYAHTLNGFIPVYTQIQR